MKGLMYCIFQEPSWRGRNDDGTGERSQTPPPQQPSRSLWIGNLDASVTGQELMQTFAVYGAVESIRLLPEKVSVLILVVAWHPETDIPNRNAPLSILFRSLRQSRPRTMCSIGLEDESR
jgi:RNA recognition motif-containing protein